MDGSIPYELFNLITTRRQWAPVKKVESVHFQTNIDFGLGSTPLLPVVANTFYFLSSLWFRGGSTLAGAPLLQVTNSGQGSPGAVSFVPTVDVTELLADIETDDLQYLVNTHSAGRIQVGGLCFKITTAGL